MAIKYLHLKCVIFVKATDDNIEYTFTTKEPQYSTLINNLNGLFMYQCCNPNLSIKECQQQFNENILKKPKINQTKKPIKELKKDEDDDGDIDIVD